MNSKLFRVITGISLLTFPPLLLAGFLMHPDILSLEMVHTVDALIANFRHQPLFHIGHLLVFLSVPFIIFSLSGLMTLKTEKGQMWLLAGGLVGIVGAVILAGDKGALCMVLSAFDTLPETDFQQITPALEAILQRKGQLALFYALPLLPLGAAMQLVGLIQSGYAKRLPGIAAIIGLLLLNNPDIEIISSIGAVLMILCYIPLGIRLIKGGDFL
jgi:hypothetical protein